MFTGFNHVGIVVHDVDEMVSFLQKAFGAKEIGRQEVPAAGQVSCMISIGTGTIELIAPFGEVEGVAGKFLKTHGPGIHHISVRSDDLESDCAHLEEVGVKVFGKMDAGVMKGAFAHPATTGGVLYELLQYK